jgi:hypothetical protein
MPVYMVGYDLNNPGKDYGELIAAIKGYGTWWHHLDSTWLIVTEQTTTEVRDYVKQFMDQNDELLVTKLSGAWATANIPKSGNDWLQKNM